MIQKSSLALRSFVAISALIASQIVLTGYIFPYEFNRKPAPEKKSVKFGSSGLSKKLKICSSRGFYTVTDRKGDRHLLLCNTPGCKDESFRIRLNKKAQWEINNALRYSRKSIETGVISTMLNLNPRASGYVLANNLQARILLVDERKSIVGDVMKSQKITLADGHRVRGDGERWRDCQAFDHFAEAIKGLAMEVRSKGPKVLSGHKFLDRLDSKVRQAQMISDSW